MGSRLGPQFAPPKGDRIGREALECRPSGSGHLARVVFLRGSDWPAVCSRNYQELLHLLPQHQDLPRWPL